jgi:hypothetical protein
MVVQMRRGFEGDGSPLNAMLLKEAKGRVVVQVKKYR